MKKHLNLLSLALATIAIGVALIPTLGWFENRGIAYVRSTEVVYGYMGMKDAQRSFLEKQNIWKANMDTMQVSYKTELDKYLAEAPGLSSKEKTEREKLLEKQKKNLITYSQTLDKKAQEEDTRVTQAVLNQINSFIAEYGKSNGYNIILGTTDAGSLMYGDENIDVTQEVLDALNRHYKGQLSLTK